MITFYEYQTESLKTAIYPFTNKELDITDRVEYSCLCLAGEVGELCNKVKKIKRDDDGKITMNKRSQIMDELGDVLWYIAILATELNVNLDFIAKSNIVKLSKRKENNTIGGEGDKR